MPRELQPWGGEVQLPRWMRRLVRRPIDPGPSAERVHDARQPQQPEASVLENAVRVNVGGFTDRHPGNRPPSRRR
jgi:hypothetical protein